MSTLRPLTADAVIFDGPLIRERALSRGLSLLKLSERSGMSVPPLLRIIDGKSHPDLMMSQVLRLAIELDTTIDGLLLRRERQPSTSDGVRVQAALLTAGRRLTISELSAALGWPRLRTFAALDELDGSLASTGAVLIRSDGKYGIGPRDGALNAAETKAIKTVRDGRSELNLGEARMLRRVAAGQLTRLHMRRVGAAARSQLGALLKHELIEDGDGGFGLTPEVEFSLGLRARPPRRRGLRRGNRPLQPSNG